MTDAGKGRMPITDQWFIVPEDWSRDGRYLVYRNGGNIWVLPMSVDAKPYPLVETQFTKQESRFSPDGRWLAFSSNETGRYEIYSGGKLRRSRLATD